MSADTPRGQRRTRPSPGVTTSLWPVARLGLNVVLTAAGLTIAGFVVIQLWLVVLPVLLALLLATLLVGPADFLRRRGIPGAGATLLVMLAALAVLVGALISVVPAIVAELDDVGRSARDGLDEVLRWLSQGPLGVEREQVSGAVDQALEGASGAGNITGSVLSGAALVVEFIAGLLLMLIVLFFFVHDGRRIWSWIVDLLPPAHRPDADAIGRRMWSTACGYVRGVAIIALVDAVLVAIALWVIGVPLVLPLAMLTSSERSCQWPAPSSRAPSPRSSHSSPKERSPQSSSSSSSPSSSSSRATCSTRSSSDAQSRCTPSRSCSP